MKQFKLIFLGLTTLVIFSVIFTTQVAAAPNDSATLATIQRVRNLIKEAMMSLEKGLGRVEDRVEELEVWTNNHNDQPQCATCTAEIAVKAVNEELAIDSLRSIELAQVKFKKDDSDQDGVFDYAESLSILFDQSNLIDIVLGTGQRRGYDYVLRLNPNQEAWFATANPIKPGKTGDRRFYVDETGVIRYSRTHEASSSSEPIGG